MTAESIEIHKAKHLLAHVLVAAGVRHWPGVILGRSGETSTGFYADFGVPTAPDENELDTLTDEMARILGEVCNFEELRLTAKEALQQFHDQPWKRHQISAIAESDAQIRCFDLDGVIDVCDCPIKRRSALRQLHPEKFLLTDAEPVTWEYRGQSYRFTRISGELFPAIEPCSCCDPD